VERGKERGKGRKVERGKGRKVERGKERGKGRKVERGKGRKGEGIGKEGGEGKRGKGRKGEGKGKEGGEVGKGRKVERGKGGVPVHAWQRLHSSQTNLSCQHDVRSSLDAIHQRLTASIQVIKLALQSETSHKKPSQTHRQIHDTKICYTMQGCGAATK
jgi:hypothetical protein